MGRDRLIPRRFSRIGRFSTPTWGVLLTSLMTIGAVLLLDVQALAKLASAFMLLLFALINLAVIVMRESEIEAMIQVSAHCYTHGRRSRDSRSPCG